MSIRYHLAILAAMNTRTLVYLGSGKTVRAGRFISFPGASRLEKFVSTLAMAVVLTAVLAVGGATRQASAAETVYAGINEYAGQAILARSGRALHGSMSVALESLYDAEAPLSEPVNPIVDSIKTYASARNLKRNDIYSIELVKQLVEKHNVLLMDPGHEGGPLFQPVVATADLDQDGVDALRTLFNDKSLSPKPVIYVADPRCGQRRLAGVTLGAVATVCGALPGVDLTADPRLVQVAVHEAAHAVIFERYQRFRGYTGLVDAAQSIFGGLKVHSVLQVNEFFGLAAEIIANDPTVFKNTLVDMTQIEVHLPAFLPDMVSSLEHQHSLGYAFFFEQLRELESRHGIAADDGIRAILDHAYDGPRAVNHFEVRDRIDEYLKQNVDEAWKRHIIDAYIETAHSIVAWLDESAPDPSLAKGDELYDSGDAAGAIAAWKQVMGAARGPAYNSIASSYAWGGRGVSADQDLAYEWRWRAIREGNTSAGYATLHAYGKYVLPSLNAIEDAIRLHGESVDFLIARSQMRERLNMLKLAEEDLVAVKKMLPGESTGLNIHGYFLADRNLRIPEALEYVREANDLTQGRSPYILDSVGWALYRNGDLDEARKIFEEANGLLPDDQAIAAHYGEVLWALGEKDVARALWSSVDRSPPMTTYEETVFRETLKRLTGKDSTN